ncbi:lipoprotein [Trinickia sp. LjRoot230]
MRVVLRISAIVAALAVATSVSLTGCGQNGPLYLPTVPPLPQKPVDQTEPSSNDKANDNAGTDTSTDTETPAPLTLEPANELGKQAPSARAAASASAASAPSSADAPNQ